MSILGNLAKTIAPIAASVFLPGSGSLVNKIMRDITGDGEEVPQSAVEDKIAEDPQLLVQYKQALMNHETELAKLEVDLERVDAGRLETVNVTMREEGKSEHWPQWLWRPFNGFLYGITIFCVYFLLPVLDKPIPSVPTEIWIGWGAVLGITTWHRGKRKRTQDGDTDQGFFLNTIKAIRIKP